MASFNLPRVQMSNQVVLEELQREIESTIDAHRREYDVAFNKLQQRVAIAFSGMHSNGEHESAPLILAKADDFTRAAVGNQGLFNLCCMSNEAQVDCVDLQNESLRGFAESGTVVDSQVAVSNRVITFDPNQASPNLTTKISNHDTPHPLQPNNAMIRRSFGRSKSELEKLELKGSGQGEFINRQMGDAKGEFEGRTNLWAFLQTKEWDSSLAQYPQNNIEVSEHEDYRSSLLGPVMGKQLGSYVHSPGFDLFVGLCILANIVVMGVMLEFEGIHSANEIGLKSDDAAADWPNAQDAFDALEHIFTMIYLIELILRVLTDGCRYFQDKLNWIDFTIVVIAIVDLYIIPLLGTKTPDLKLIRLMRVIRIFRVLRMVRLLKLLPKLRALVLAVSNSIWSLIWAMMLLAIYMTFAAVFMTQSLQHYFVDEAADVAQRQQVYQYFGNFTRSLITMFEITLYGGTWGRCGRVVIFSVNRWYALFFLGYMGFVSFAMIRVIAALFLKDTLASSEKAGVQAMAETNKDPNYVRKIYNVFKSMDYDDDGQIQFSELTMAVQDAGIVKDLEGLGVAPHEVLGLFTLMDDGDDEISFCEFITGIMRLKNIGRGVDLATLLYENKKLLKRVLGVGNEVTALKKLINR